MATNSPHKVIITCAITGNLTLARSNAELVTHAAGILRALGASIADPAEARAMLGLS